MRCDSVLVNGSLPWRGCRSNTAFRPDRYDEDFKSPHQPEGYLKHTKGHVCYDPAKVRTSRWRWPGCMTPVHDPDVLEIFACAPFQQHASRIRCPCCSCGAFWATCDVV